MHRSIKSKFKIMPTRRSRYLKDSEEAKEAIMHVNSADILFTRNVPHIIEMIFLSLDYKSLKVCFEVSNTWNELLTSESFQRKATSVFQYELLEDERKLWLVSSEGKLD